MLKTAIFVAILAAGGCAPRERLDAGLDPYTPPAKPVSEMTPAERCQNLFRLMGNAYGTPAQHAALYERARNDGCMGDPRPQTVIIR
jgi:hypothetical protein